ERRTEGWAAALQIAALTLRGRSTLASGIAAFKGSHRLVMEYVTSEVLDRLPPQQQRFIMRTAILERMCASLCDAVLRLEARGLRLVEARNTTLKPKASSLILQELERANLFIIPLDDERTWYRYHPLFVEVARERLRAAVSANELAALHQNASLWYE